MECLRFPCIERERSLRQFLSQRVERMELFSVCLFCCARVSLVSQPFSACFSLHLLFFFVVYLDVQELQAFRFYTWSLRACYDRCLSSILTECLGGSIYPSSYRCALAAMCRPCRNVDAHTYLQSLIQMHVFLSVCLYAC